MPASAYKSELNAIPAPYREPLRAYFEEGEQPREPVILALCAGDLLIAIDAVEYMDDLKRIIRFMQRHMGGCYGSPMIMMRWCVMHRTLRDLALAS